MTKTTLLGTSLSRYRICCNGTHAVTSTAAHNLQKWITHLCGTELLICSSSAADDACIVIESIPLAAYGEGNLCTKNGNVFIQGNDIVGLSEAAAFLVMLLSQEGAYVTEEMLHYHTTLPLREHYATNVTAFLPCYRYVHTPPPERSLAQKHRVLNDPTERPFVIAHRGEHVFYPENSLEGAISAWYCGADAVEVDIQKSADGVWMCMHDSDVTRTTNAAEYLGKEGFPSSPLLRDWTYAQLRTLRLKDAYGAQTPFPIPTLTEILHACDGRIYLHLDKAFSVEKDVFPFMEKEGVFDCVYLVNHVSIEDILHLKDHFADRGVHLDSLPRPRRRFGQTPTQVLPVILKHLPHTTPALIPIGDYVAHGNEENELIARYKDTLRFGAWFLRDFDYEALWRQARAQGISIFMTDHPLDLIALGL